VPGLPERRPLLVTGMARSGTSWVGKMLEVGGQFVYVNEPMNPRHPPGRSPGILRADITQDYLYITDDNGPAYLEAFRDTVAFRYHAVAEVRRNHRPFDLAKMAKYWTAFTLGRLRGRRAMLNDPYATLAARWLAQELGSQVVVVVRQPAAMLASFRKLGYRNLAFRDLLDQPLLMRDWLEPLRAEMETVEEGDLVGQVALLWRILHRVTAAYRSTLPGFVVVRHEDLSVDPIGAYERLHDALALPFTDEVRAAVAEGSGLTPAKATGNSDKTHVWRLSRRGFLSRTAYRPMDSRASLGSWCSAVTPEEIARIRWLTEDVAPLYYTSEELDWLLAGAPADVPSPLGGMCPAS
jgi:hypothetical protein